MAKEMKDQLLTGYAAMALYDGGAEVSADQINTLIKATGNEVEAYWPTLYSGFLKGQVAEIITTPGSGGGGGGGGEGGAAAAGGDAAEAKEEEKEEEEEEEIDMGGGMDMFGDEGGGGDDY